MDFLLMIIEVLQQRMVPKECCRSRPLSRHLPDLLECKTKSMASLMSMPIHGHPHSVQIAVYPIFHPNFTNPTFFPLPSSLPHPQAVGPPPFRTSTPPAVVSTHSQFLRRETRTHSGHHRRPPTHRRSRSLSIRHPPHPLSARPLPHPL
jgi:hypothetical protein